MHFLYHQFYSDQDLKGLHNIANSNFLLFKGQIDLTLKMFGENDAY